MKIIAAMKDPGGTNATLPVALALRQLGHDVTLVVPPDSVAATLLRQKGLDFHALSDPQTVVDTIGMPVVLLTSMCSGGGVGRDLVPLVRGQAHVVAVTDQWYSSITGSWHDARYRPDYVMVNDTIGRDLILTAWQDYTPQQIEVRGFAALDALCGFDSGAARTRVRDRLGLTDEPCVYYSGQLIASAAAAKEIAAAIHEIRSEFPSVKLLAGVHPRLNLANPRYAAEAAGVEEAMSTIAECAVRLPAGEERIPELDLIAASEVTVGMYTTALMHAAAMRKPAISVLYPGSLMQQEYLRENGGLLTQHALVDLGCVAGPKDRREFVRDLRAALSGTLERDLSEAQEMELMTDGQNAMRIALFVDRLKD